MMLFSRIVVRNNFRPIVIAITAMGIDALTVRPAFKARYTVAAPNKQQEFLNLIKKFSTHTDDITLSHPRFGALNTKEWGVFVWMHLDHHLRQFGV